jgi:hypothetical protein
MADKKPLRISSAFGPSRDQTLLLAVHPDEEHDRAGNPVPHRRTLILALQGDQAAFVEQRPVPLVRAWYSPLSGVAYCTSVASNKIYKWKSGAWSDEVFSSSVVDFVTFIYGFPEKSANDDQLFLATEKGLFVRTRGVWEHHSLDGEGFAYQIHGRIPTEIFVGGEALHKWDGQRAQVIEAPTDDSISGLCVTSDDRLVGGNTYLNVLEPDGTWARIETPVHEFGMLIEHRGALYATASSAGVMRVLPSPAVLVTPPHEIDRLVDVGDALIAVGDDISLVGDGAAWTPIHVPLCEVGQMP